MKKKENCPPNKKKKAPPAAAAAPSLSATAGTGGNRTSKGAPPGGMFMSHNSYHPGGAFPFQQHMVGMPPPPYDRPYYPGPALPVPAPPPKNKGAKGGKGGTKKKGKAKSHGQGYEGDEIDFLLDSIELIKPIGSTEWEAVKNQHDTVYPDMGRESASLKKKFQTLYKFVFINLLSCWYFDF